MNILQQRCRESCLYVSVTKWLHLAAIRPFRYSKVAALHSMNTDMILEEVKRNRRGNVVPEEGSRTTPTLTLLGKNHMKLNIVAINAFSRLQR